MVTPHQQILASMGKLDRLKLTILDTPFGFQENADDLTEKLIEFFAHSVGATPKAISLRNASVNGAALGEAVNSIRDSDWLFAGPGSPSYALKVWHELGVSPHFDEVLVDGTVVLASAAALTAGSHTIPVYEMYKVGEEPHWLPGLNLIERHTGMPAAIIPHYDNADGANHDTRFCYIGERRLRVMESLLPPEVFIIGVDEHTGIRFDLDERTAHVFGRGTMTIRHHGESWTVVSGESATFEEIISHTGSTIVLGEPAPLFKVDPHKVEQLLDRDTETRAAVHSLVTRLGHIAASPKVDIMSVIGPYVDALLQARQAARAGGRWDDADAIRDQLMEMKVTIQDTKDGSSWEIESS
jgi:hypothetical protein